MYVMFLGLSTLVAMLTRYIINNFMLHWVLMMNTFSFTFGTYIIQYFTKTAFQKFCVLFTFLNVLPQLFIFIFYFEVKFCDLVVLFRSCISFLIFLRLCILVRTT